MQQVVCNLVGGNPRPALRIQSSPFLPAPRLITVAQQGPPATATPMLLATQPTVVLANQSSGPLKSSPAYMMGGATGPPAMVVGGQPLKGIKVIPVPPRGARPLLARLIGPAGLRAVQPASSLIVQVSISVQQISSATASADALNFSDTSNVTTRSSHRNRAASFSS
ncbi:hypothetical protein HPB51_025573 [Rhipicephalus microplus]|uniref:Uncharacterized protein n=1 Tax=Rhipicephalus microplus TaxID=6941 RepID=A0A9J6DRC7_RHIMP|nr:hypothetical protein HPB51_025573 [Rhipicephalus microplus]